MKIRPLGSGLLHADRRTGMKKLIVAFHNSANAPKMKCVTVMVYLKSVTLGCLRTIRSFSLGSNFEVQ